LSALVDELPLNASKRPPEVLPPIPKKIRPPPISSAREA
jgi:hypothetical protein